MNTKMKSRLAALEKTFTTDFDAFFWRMFREAAEHMEEKTLVMLQQFCGRGAPLHAITAEESAALQKVTDGMVKAMERAEARGERIPPAPASSPTAWGCPDHARQQRNRLGARLSD